MSQSTYVPNTRSLETTKLRLHVRFSKVISHTVQPAYTFWAILIKQSATGIDNIAIEVRNYSLLTGAHILLSHLSLTFHPDTGTGSEHRNRTLISSCVQPLVKQALQFVTLFHISKACRVASTRSES